MTIRIGAVIMAALLAADANAQSLFSRMASADGLVQVRFASQPGVCGDGIGSIENVLGRHSQFFGDNGVNFGSRDLRRPCVPGPVRVVANVAGGQVVHLRTYVGPEPDLRKEIADFGTVPVAEATAWLERLVASADGRVSTDAMLPLVIAEGSAPWRDFSRIAMDSTRGKAVRRQAMFWLGEASLAKLGLADAGSGASDEDDVKAQAVFALSQLPRERSVPQLMRLARTSENGSVRAAAIFWLGQTGDQRAAEVFRDLLGLR
jgi:hypothetical protein